MSAVLRYSSTLGIALMSFVFLVASPFVDPVEAKALVFCGLFLMLVVPLFLFLETKIARSYK